VLLKRLDGVQIASLNTGTIGAVTFANVPADTGSVLIEIKGSASSQYYDEALQTAVAFGAEKVLRSAVAVLQASANIGVSALTEAAVARAEKMNGGLTAANITAANAAVSAAFSLPDILQAPVLVGSASDMTALPNSAAGQYALKLGALAKVAQTQNSSLTAPALTIAESIAKDFSDGVFDGKENASAITALPYNLQSFAASWMAAAATLANGNANLVSYLSNANFSVQIPADAAGSGSNSTPQTSMPLTISNANPASVAGTLDKTIVPFQNESGISDSSGNYQSNNAGNGHCRVAFYAMTNSGNGKKYALTVTFDKVTKAPGMILLSEDATSSTFAARVASNAKGFSVNIVNRRITFSNTELGALPGNAATLNGTLEYETNAVVADRASCG
jgi:hypothetical protein